MKYSAGLLAFLPVVAHATDVQLSHQGRLLSSQGDPIEGAVTLTIQLMDGPGESAQAVFTDVISTSVADGFYHVDLGANPSNRLDASALVGEVWVDISAAGVPLQSRQRLARVPAAATAYVAPSTSMVRVVGFAGYGSDNAAIVRFSTDVQTVGDGIVWTSSASQGDSFTVAMDAVCTLSLSASHSTSWNALGLSKNVADGHPDLDDQAIYVDSANGHEKRLAWRHNGTTEGYDTSLSWTGLLQANDVVRVHGRPGLSIAGRENRWGLTMTCTP